jgi:hypothetical protein
MNRRELTAWAMNNRGLGVNGNSKSDDIRVAIRNLN